jgi:hypothetical protein
MRHTQCQKAQRKSQSSRQGALLDDLQLVLQGLAEVSLAAGVGVLMALVIAMLAFSVFVLWSAA